LELSLPQLHSFPAHSLFLVTFEVAVEELLLANAVAAALSSAEVTRAQPPVAGLLYFPAAQVSCLTPYMPGAQTLRQVSNPAMQAVAVLPLLAEFDPGHSTSVDSVAPATLSTSACVSDAV
jgi:hypothetical protein